MTETLRPCPNCGADNPGRARFCWSCGTALAEATARESETRKTVTILFCDLVGSTALGEQLDPETLRGKLNRSFDRVSAIVERHGGVVEKFIGDAAMAVFGIPRLHEDDALRAVRAAADIREALADGEGGLAWRTGIATGEVVAGDASAGQRLITGDAVNVAARLQQSAQPGEILVTAETVQLVRDAVEVEPMGELQLKGRASAIVAYRLVAVDQSAAGHERRLDSPMVGRDRPLRLLADAFAEVRDQRVCHLFTVLGAAGVGKSRLVNEFVASLDDAARVVRGRCLSYGEGITYWPIGEIVRDVIGEVGGVEEEFTRLTALLEGVRDGTRAAERVGAAIGLTGAEPAPEETPWAIRSLFESLAVDRPLVVVLDDLHWAESALLDLVDHVADWSQGAPILLLVSARRELLDLRPSWGGGKRSASTISLEPLNADETAELIDNLLGQANLPATVFDRIRSVAEGNPLFVEELLEMLIDEGTLARADVAWEVRRDLAATAMPPTIQALLAARLDGLGTPERAVLERASVEGTVFHRDAVTALSPEQLPDAVGTSLQSLTRREFVAPDRAELGGREAFRFRHQLIRDAAYQAIAKQSRADLHEQFATWLELALGDRLDEYRPILGYHLEQAARYRRELDPADTHLTDVGHAAAEHLGLAGRAALGRGDLDAAANLLVRAATLEADRAAVIRWRLLAGEAMSVGSPAGGPAAASAFLVETRQLAEASGDARSAAMAEVYRIHPRISTGEPTLAMIEDAERLRRVLTDLGDAGGAGRAGLELAKLKYFQGHVQDAITLGSELLQHLVGGAPYRDELRRWLASFSYWGPTPADEALALVQRLRREADDPRSFGSLRMIRNEGALLGLLGRFDEARAAFVEERDAFRQFGDEIHIASLESMFMAPVELLAGNATAAVTLARSGFNALMDARSPGFANTAAAYLARSLFAVGDHDEALRISTVAMELGNDDDPAAVPPALGVAARVHALRGETERAEVMARRGVAQLAASDYVILVGESHVDLAEVLLVAGRPVEATDELRAALAAFEQKGSNVHADQARRRLEEIG